MNAKIFIILVITTLTRADKRCRGIYIDNRYYNLDIMKEGVNHIYDLEINRHDNTIFYTYEDLSYYPTRLLGKLDTETRLTTVINGIRNASAIAIDQYNGKIFVGGSEGLYKINDRNIPERMPIQDDIIHMHYKNVLYFVNRRKEAFTFEDGFASPVPELRGVQVDNLVIDDSNNIFFVQNNKLFRIKLGTRAINTHENVVPNCLGTDAYSRVYVCTNRGLYVYNKYKYVLDKVADLTNLKIIRFNKMNEPLYAVADHIIKLNISPIGCFED